MALQRWWDWPTLGMLAYPSSFSAVTLLVGSDDPLNDL